MKGIILTAVISALLAVAGSIYVGVKTFDGPVIEHAYEEGLRWDERENEKKDLGWHVVLNGRNFRRGDNKLVLSVLDGQGAALANSSVAITISRPSTGAYDRQYNAAMGQDGLWRTAVTLPLYGYWDLRIAVAQGDHEVLFEKRVYAEKR